MRCSKKTGVLETRTREQEKPSKKSVGEPVAVALGNKSFKAFDL
jgi:hypothetical protein